MKSSPSGHRFFISRADRGRPAHQSRQESPMLARRTTLAAFAMAGGLVLAATPRDLSAQSAPDCAAAYTAIPAIQGSGPSAAISGNVTTQGIVVGDFEGARPTLRGFYLQDRAGDGDAATSDGIFVFNGDNDSVAVGDVVRVTGTAAEFQGQTQVSASVVTKCATGPRIQPVEVTLPVPSAGYLERYEGMLVRLPQTLYVTEHFQLGRFGQAVLSAGDRLRQPTEVVAPGAPALALAAANSLSRIIVDDALNNQNPDPIVFGRDGQPLSAANTLRAGDSVTGMVGVMTYSWAGNSASGNAWRVRPVDAFDGGLPQFAAANPRPAAPPAVGGTLKVASFNVLNYFLTLDIGTQRNCGPVGFKQECRGAETAAEFQRQRAKLLAALARLDADVVGVNELENSEDATGLPVDPLADVVVGLNALQGAGTWSYVDTGIVGTDTIRVGLIYRPAKVRTVGPPRVLDSSVDARFDDTRQRPVLAQTFEEVANGTRVTAAVAHFKSKSAPANDDPAAVCLDSNPANDIDDCDQRDGQGYFNHTRTQAALALRDWLASDPTGSGDPDVLILGDLNAYAKEDPVRVLLEAGYSDLLPLFAGSQSYSYVFDGQWGSLDHALASGSMVLQVAGAADYHTNADEPSVLDYNTNFKSAGQVASLYAADEFRASDHDPLLVGLYRLYQYFFPLVGR
jgi:predicted extracellular nuclease